MNFIDTFFAERLNVELHCRRPDVIKNVPIEEILNINPVESTSSKIRSRLRNRTIHIKNDKENLYNAEYAPSKSALNINTNKRNYSSNVLGENSLLNLTTCRSARLRNKLNADILNNPIYQSSLIIKPLKQNRNKNVENNSGQSEVVNYSSRHETTTCRRSARLRNKSNADVLNNSIYQPSLIIKPQKKNRNKNVENNSAQSEVINYSNSHEDVIKSTHLNNSKILKLACDGKSTNAGNAKKCKVASKKSISDLVENKNCVQQKIKRKLNDNKPKTSESKKSKNVCNSRNSSSERLQKKIKNTNTAKNEEKIALTESKKSIENDLKPKDKKIAKLGTLKYLKERQNFMKGLLLEENPTDYMEACGRKKNKALENLVKLGADETLSIKTPKEKGKGKEVYCGMTPRTALLNDWSEAIGCPSWTPKDVSNSKSKQENEQDALKVLYHHLKAKPSRRNKADWAKLRTPVKISKETRRGKENYFDYSLNFGEAEKKVIDCLSEKPSKDLNDSNSDDDYFNLSE